MASKELKHLSLGTQVLHNKFIDRIRRDTMMRSSGFTPMLTCTHRTEQEQKLLNDINLGPRTSHICDVGNDGKPASKVFEIVMLYYGAPFVAHDADILEKLASYAAELDIEMVIEPTGVLSFRGKS